MTSAVLSARFDAAVPVFGILGDGRIHRSRSPAMFSRILARVGLNGVCVPFQVAPEDLDAAVASLRILHLAGAKIEAPYQEKVAACLDVLSEGANIVGAVNTVVRRKTILKGYNTNAIGIMETLEARGVEAAGSRAIVFGTGGAARAAVFILTWLRAERVWVAGRNAEAAARLTASLGGTVLDWRDSAPAAAEADLVINATGVSGPDEAPELERVVSALPLGRCRLVLDLNYDRRDNFWRDLAEARGCPFCDGLDTLAREARRSFFLWTGIEVEPEHFMAALRQTPLAETAEDGKA